MHRPVLKTIAEHLLIFVASETMDPSTDHLSFFMDNPHIFDVIFSSLSQNSIVQCSRTSKQMHAAAADFNKRAFDINKHLARHFQDGTAFRTLQCHTGLIISGSSAVQFFDRTHFLGSDLDLYVVQDFGFRVAQWLTDHEGYRYAPKEDDCDDFEEMLAIAIDMGPDAEECHEPYANGGVIGVFNFQKEGFATIQLVCSAVSPIHAVLSFHSTCVMNFITFEGAYSLYPLATFVTRQALAIGGPKLEARAKYASRGWTIYDHLSIPDSLKTIFFPDRLRRVLDSKTWAITFDVTNIPICGAILRTTKAMTWDPALPNSWVLPQIVADTLIRRSMHFAVFSSATLQCKYLVGNERVLYNLSAMFKNFDKEEQRKYMLRGKMDGQSRWRYRDYEFASYIGEYNVIAPK